MKTIVNRYLRPDEPPAGGTPPIDPPLEPIGMKNLRESRDAAIAEAKEAKTQLELANAKLTENDRAKLQDNERLTLELSDAKKKADELMPLQERTAALEGKFTALFEKQVAALPTPELQDRARSLTSGITSPEAKFDMLQELSDLLVPPVAPRVAGGANGAPPPGFVPPVVNPPAQTDPKDWANIDTQKAMLEVASDPARTAALQFNYPKPAKTE